LVVFCGHVAKGVPTITRSNIGMRIIGCAKFRRSADF
jgi:hypothetical protein